MDHHLPGLLPCGRISHPSGVEEIGPNKIGFCPITFDRGGQPGDHTEEDANCHQDAHRELYFSTVNSFVTENTPETEFARALARILSALFATTPTSVTWPFFTMMWIGGTA